MFWELKVGKNVDSRMLICYWMELNVLYVFKVEGLEVLWLNNIVVNYGDI